MKICFLAASNSIHSHQWINFFSNLGHKIIWISLVPATIKVSDNIEYYEFTSGIFSSIFKVRKLIAKLNPDIVHIHYLGYYGLLGLFSGAKCIVSTPWGSDIIEGKKSFLKRQILLRILNKTKLIICDAYHMRDELKKLNVPQNKINIIYFGVDTKKFVRKDRNLEILNKFNISNEITIISIRSFEPVYDIKTLILAAKIILKQIPDVHFLLVGRGTLEKELKELVHSLSIDNSVHFTGFIDKQLLPSLLSSSDIYVSTSLSDAGLASSTGEAMSCETPVVISDSAENDQWINNKVNGFLFSTKNSEQLAEILINLIKNEPLRKTVGKEGRNIIIKKYDYENEMNKVNDLYLKLI
jgi:glycosyltransferase involved in cell wall biosynthesis